MPDATLTSEPQFRPQHHTLLQALERVAAQTPNRTVTVLGERPTDPDQVLGYADLVQRVDALAAGLHALGVAAGDAVLLVFPTGFDFVLAFFACQRLRAIPVPTYPPSSLRADAELARLAQIASRARARHCLTDAALMPLVQELAGRVSGLKIRPIAEVQAASSRHVAFEPAAPSDLAFVQFTSGSTGNPKGVMLTHANLTANLHAIGLALEITPRDVFVNWCPLYHDMGLIGTVLSAVYWQLPLVLMSTTAFIRHPVRWLRAIDAHRGTISAGPNFAYALAEARVNGKRREGLDLSSWRIASNGAEPVNPQTIEAFTRAYEPCGFRPEAMFPVYGMAESSLAVAFPPLGRRPRFDTVERLALARGVAEPAAADGGGTKLVGVGRPLPGHQIRIVAADGTVAAERIVGEIQLSGPSIMPGYFDDAAATSEAFDGAWLRTGDLGYWADEELYIVGRSKDVIIVRGRKLHPEDIERSIDPLPGVRAGNVVAFGVYDEAVAEDRLVIVAEYAPGSRSDDHELMQRMRDTVLRDHALPAKDVRLVPRGSIPKTSSGKRQRARCRAQYLAGDLLR